MSRWRDVKQGRAEAPRKQEEQESGTPEYSCAPVTLRLKAFLTDTFMITMPILYIIIYLIMGSREGFREHLAEGWFYIVVIHMSIVVLLWRFKTQTPGMKAYDLYLVDPQSEGGRPGWIKCLLRYVMMQTAILSIFGLILPFVMKHKEGLQDIVSGTCIVHKP
ncbi:RDD family protein [Hydrogenimonas sp.]